MDQGTTTAQALGSVVGGDRLASPAAHTPGPWWIVRPPKYGAHFAAGANIEIRPQDVVTARDRNGWPVAAVSVHSPDAEANARLIAAAPDMLAALVAIRENFWRGDFIKADNLAQVAIAKAEGRE